VRLTRKGHLRAWKRGAAANTRLRERVHALCQATATTNGRGRRRQGRPLRTGWHSSTLPSESAWPRIGFFSRRSRVTGGSQVFSFPKNKRGGKWKEKKEKGNRKSRGTSDETLKVQRRQVRGAPVVGKVPEEVALDEIQKKEEHGSDDKRGGMGGLRSLRGKGQSVKEQKMNPSSWAERSSTKNVAEGKTANGKRSGMVYSSGGCWNIRKWPNTYTKGGGKRGGSNERNRWPVIIEGNCHQKHLAGNIGHLF